MVNLHKCEGIVPSGGYGEAIERCCGTESGELWIDNGEYSSRVNFCPYCGFAAERQMKFVEVNNEFGNYFEAVD